MKAICKKLLVLLSVALMLTSIGLILTTSKYATAKATTFDVFEMKDGASVKFADNNSGIRFLVKMDKDTKDYIVDNNSVTLKFIITSKTLYDAKTDGQYWNVSKKEVVNVDESKIYQNGDYWYANGCLTQLLAANRKVNLVAIAAIYDGSSYTYASVDTVGAVGSMYDTLNQALLSSSRDYIPSIIDTDAFDWYGTASYPVFINTSANYEKLAAKFAIKSDVLKVLKYNIVDEVNAGTIDNAEFNSNVTTTYRVTFDPNNGAAATSKVYTYGATIAVPSDPAKDGNVFKGWGNPATCTGSATYTAAFAEIPVFTLNYLQNSLVNGVTYFDVPAEEGYIYSVSNNKIVNENGDEISASVSAGRIVPTSALSAGNYSVSIVGTNSEYDDVYSTETIKFRVYNDNSELAPKFNTGSADVDNSSNSYVMSLSDVSGITAFDDIEWFNAYKFEAKRNSTSDQRINFGNTLTASHFKYLAMDIYVDETTAYNWYFALTTGNNLTTLNRYVFNKSTGALVSTTKNGTLDLDTWYTIVYVLDSATDAMTLWHSWSGTNTTGTAYFANVAFYDTDFAAAVPTAQAFSGTYLQNTLVKGANSIALPSTGYAYTVESSNNNASISAGNINFASSLSSGNYSITLSATFDTGVTILNSLYPRNVSKTINYRVYNDNSELAPKFNTPADANSMVTQLSDVSEINAFNGIEWFNAYRFNATAGAADGQRINFMIRNTDNSTLTASNFKYLAMDIYVDDTSVKSGANSNWYFAGATGYNLTTIDRYVFNKSTGALVSTAKNGNLDLDTWYTVVYVLDNATDKMTLWHTWSGSPTGTAYFANVTFYDTDFAAAVPTAQAFSGTYLQNTLVKGATSVALPSTGYTYTIAASDNSASISAGNINFAKALYSGNYSITLNATFDTGVTILNSLCEDSKTIYYRVYNNASELAPKFNTPADANSTVTQLSDVSEISAFDDIEYFNAYKFEAKAGAADGQRINFMIRGTDNSTLTASNFKYLSMDIYVDDTNTGDTSNWYFAGATGYNLTTIDRYVFNKSTGALVSTAKNGTLNLDTWYTVVYVLDNATDKMTLWHTWSGSPTGTAYFANVAFYDKNYCNVGGQTGNGGTLPTIGIGGVENGSLIYDVSGNNSSLQLFRFFSFGTPDNETYDYLEFDFLFDSYQSVTSDNFTDGKMPVVCTGYHSSVSSTPNAVYDMEGNLLYTYATNNTVSGANLQYGTWYHIKVALNSNTSPLYMTMYNGAGNYNIHLQIKNISCS